MADGARKRNLSVTLPWAILFFDEVRLYFIIHPQNAALLVQGMNELGVFYSPHDIPSAFTISMAQNTPPTDLPDGA